MCNFRMFSAKLMGTKKKREKIIYDWENYQGSSKNFRNRRKLPSVDPDQNKTVTNRKVCVVLNVL